MIKNKIQSELQKLGVNLEEAKQNKWVEVFANQLNEDSSDEDISNYIKGFEGIIKAQASTDDTVRSLKADFAKAKKPTEPTPTPEQPKDDTPEWAKALLQKVESLETAKVQETLFGKFSKDERVNKVPKQLLETFAPKSADDYEQAIEKVNDLMVEINKTNLTNTTPPNGTGKQTTATSKEIEDLAKDIL